ncbi:hypothetical protein [Aliikangiella coralliicola]|uniref:DUF4402 domain-containing protein n=1 Tax=Aliikangiella coralliicola TaxID=2592383 RepID=A0A545UHU1_9GAMM|nr:hypothetical protein [Aliikangiella coralliicola]TQV89035.1 hypothetical protein FLL46_05760 [Aliikangiella coralliicola]
MKYARLVKASIFALGVASTSAMAATQGTLGATSTGDLIISLDIDNLVRVSNLNDINLGNFNGGAGDLSGSDTFCVYRNGAGNYNINMSGSGAANAYTLASGANTLPYAVEFVNGATTTAMATGTALTGQTGANTTSDTCGGADNVSLNVTVANGDLAAAPAGTYTGTLTIVVAPE